MSHAILPFATFAANAHAEAFPALARARAVDAITDCLGCILAGTVEAVSVKTMGLVGATAASPAPGLEAPLIGGGFGAPAAVALYHGAAAHALDFDDTNHPAYAHPSAVLVPALLAAGAGRGLTGRDLVRAYIVGFEMFGKLGRALNTSHYAHGWHATNTFGALAAALAVGALERTAPERIIAAVGIAASMAGGLRANFGTMVKPLHAGLAARAGVEAARLAADGFTAAADAMEHRFGFLAVFAGAEPARPAALATPGAVLEILTEYGLALKPYPACGATHPGIEAALRIRSRLAPDEAIGRVRVGIAAMARNPLIHARPATGLEGKFSMEFCTAAALLDGAVTLGTFTDARVARDDVAALIGRIAVEVDDRVRDSPEFATVIRLETASGRVEEELVPLAQGKPDRWMSQETIGAKFRDCARYGRAAIDVDAALAALHDLDTAMPLDAILRHLTPVRSAAALEPAHA